MFFLNLGSFVISIIGIFTIKDYKLIIIARLIDDIFDINAKINLLYILFFFSFV